MSENKEDIQLPVENQRMSVLELPLPDAMRFIKNSTPRDIFPGFGKGYSTFGMNNGSFSFADVIEYILNHTGPAHALLSSWVASRAAGEKVIDLMNNRRLLSAKFLVDKMVMETRGNFYELIVRRFGVDAIRTSLVHAKFCVLRNNDWSVVIETSANLNRNRRLESFRITENERFCLFFEEIFDNFFNVISPKENGSLASARKINQVPDILEKSPQVTPDFQNDEPSALLKKLNADSLKISFDKLPDGVG